MAVERQRDLVDPKKVFPPTDPKIEEILKHLEKKAFTLEEFLQLLELKRKAKEDQLRGKYQGWAAVCSFMLYVLAVLFTGTMYVLQGTGVLDLPSELLWGLVILTIGQSATLVAVVFRWLFGGELSIPSPRLSKGKENN